MNSKTNFKYTDNISLSGYKMIKLFVLLSKGACGEAEINQMYIEDELVGKPQSKDTIKSYINLLRLVGCEISRPTKTNNYKYFLTKYTFKPDIKDEVILGLSKIKKDLSSINDWKFLLALSDLYKKTDDFFLSGDKEGALSFDSTMLSSLDRSMIYQIEKFCASKRVITIEYNSPNSGVKNIQILPEYLFFENGYLYLWGQNPELKENFYLRLDRIKSIDVVEFKQACVSKKTFKVVYSLKGNSLLAFRENDSRKIIEKTSEYIKIEAVVSNEFHFIQEVLGYGADCEVISPESLKNQLAEKIKSVLRIYEEEDCI